MNTTVACRPTQIERLADRLAVQWNDGHKREYSHKVLRAECPCARCKAEDPLRILSADASSRDLTVVDIQPVGRYAIRLIWSDGHRTGIYTFEFLRRLCEDSIAKD